jgi:CheY-like chemotaxis protein
MREKKTVFIVDDDYDDIEMFIEAVAEIDPAINCIKASNGYEALQLLNKGEIIPDYIFLDLNMPRMSGKQCLDQIKKDENFQAIPVIIYTTTRLIEDKQELLELGAERFITKPSNMTTLVKELKIVLSEL